MRWSRHPDHVRSFDQDAAQIGAQAYHYAGIRSIPVAAIVGSVGRSHELRSDFLTTDRSERDERYRRVLLAMKSGVSLPAIEVYQLGSRYYVLDGNHRVAAARAIGQMDIDADVIAYQATDTCARDQAAAA